MIIALVGPSGSGKSTVAALVEERLGLKKALKCTTRRKRNDQDTDYVFTDETDFFNRVRSGELIEFAYYHGNFYGIITPHDNCLVNCEPLGAMHVRKWAYQHRIPCKLVYLDCPDAIRTQRMVGRGDFLESIEERLEVDRYFEAFKSGFDAVVDASGTVEQTFEGIKTILEKR